MSPTIPTLIALTMAFQSLLRRPITLADLVHHEGRVEINDSISIPAEKLAKFFSSDPVAITASDVPAFTAQASAAAGAWRHEFFDDPEWLEPHKLDLFNGVQEALRTATGAEERAAKDVGISTTQLVIESVKLWGRGFTEERDARAGENASNQKRGRIARVMKDELRQAISHGDD